MTPASIASSSQIADFVNCFRCTGITIGAALKIVEICVAQITQMLMGPACNPVWRLVEFVSFAFVARQLSNETG